MSETPPNKGAAGNSRCPFQLRLIYEFVRHIFISTSRSAAVPELWTFDDMKRTTILVAILLCGCTTRSALNREMSRGAYEQDLVSAHLELEALKALSAGNTNRAIYLLQVGVFGTTRFLPDIASEAGVSVGAQGDALTSECDTPTNAVQYAHAVLEYMEQSPQSLNPSSPLVKHCLKGLRVLLTAPEDQRRLDVLEQRLHDLRVEQFGSANGASPRR